MPAEINRGKKQEEKAKLWNIKMAVIFDLEKIEQF